MNLALPTDPAAPIRKGRFSRGAALLAVPLALWAGAGQAGSVNVEVTDAAGRSLPRAVVTLEPVAGKLAVKPNHWLEVSQARRQFDPQISLVTVGTAVVFSNFDTVRHHVYSFSPTKTFELKLYAGVPNMPVVFEKPGVAVIGCNIHDHMAAWIAVVDTPFYGQTGADGKTRIPAVAAGNYRLRVWHPGLVGNTDGVVQPLDVGAHDVDRSVQLKIGGNPLVSPL